MVWRKTCAMEERPRFMHAVVDNEETFAAVCRRFEVSRKTGYKWLERYGDEGVAGLKDRSRAPLHHPQAMPERIAEQCLAVRRAHPTWGLEQGAGTGHSDAFQAGVYGIKYFGPAYVGGALAFTNNWFTTTRTALGDAVTANFQGQSYGTRLEGGYRYAVTPPIGLTPYAALQAQSFHTPAYSETDLTGGGFGLSYNAMTASDTRSELGARFDDLTLWGDMPLQLRARLAWAHDWVSDPALSAVFQTLPGTSFVVNGAPVPQNSALTSLGAELHLTARWTLIAKFDGEFASSAQTYAGSGTLRYTW